MQDLRPLYVAAILTWVAGVVDAIGFLSLGHIYTANMSGNSIAIGIEGVRQNWPEFLARLWPVAIYFAGLLFCRLLIDFGARRKISAIAAVTLGTEICILLPAAMLSGRTGHVPQDLQVAYVALFALAMGVQNAALTHFSHLTLHTGFVTGTLLKAAEYSAGYLTWLIDESRRHGTLAAFAQSKKQEPFREALILSGIWIAYVAGAALGTVSASKFSFRAVFIGVSALLIVIAMDLRKPLAKKEEQQQQKVKAG